MTSFWQTRSFYLGASGSMLALPWLELNAEKRSNKEMHRAFPAICILLFAHGLCEGSLFSLETGNDDFLWRCLP